MFYTLTTKFLIKKNGGEREFFYIFLVGSAMYVGIHWYMFNKAGSECKMSAIAGKYLYYLMMCDLAIAYLVYRMAPVRSKKLIQETTKLDLNKPHTNKQEPRQLSDKEIAAKVEEVRQFQQRQKETARAPEKVPDKEQDCQLTKPKTECSKNDEKCKIFKESDKSEEPQREKKTKEIRVAKKDRTSDKKKEDQNEEQDKETYENKQIDTDTEIPVFVQKVENK